MSSSSISLADHVLSLFTIGFLRVSAALPIAFVRAFAVGIGRVALFLLPRLHRVGMQNLDLAYGDTLSSAEKRRVLRGAMDNMALVAAEFSRLPLLAGQGSVPWVDVEGVEQVDLARGGILISGHLGNWEFMASAVARHGVKIAEVVRPLRHPRVNEIVDATRRAGGFDTIPKAKAAVEVFRRMRAGELVGVLIDQAPRESAVPVTFFGKPCWATAAPVIFAVRGKAPVHLAVMRRKPDGRYALRVSPAITLTRSGDFRQDLLENSQRLQDALEAEIRENPEQWLWFHRRWKARPQLEAEWNARAKRDNDTTE